MAFDKAWHIVQNARRGSEPARTLIKDFEERDSWIDTTKISSDDAAAMDKYSITFIMGKGAALSDDAAAMDNYSIAVITGKEATLSDDATVMDNYSIAVITG